MARHRTALSFALGFLVGVALALGVRHEAQDGRIVEAIRDFLVFDAGDAAEAAKEYGLENRQRG